MGLGLGWWVDEVNSPWIICLLSIIWCSNIMHEFQMLKLSSVCIFPDSLSRWNWTLERWLFFSSSDKALLVHRLCEFHQIGWVLCDLHDALCSVLWVAFTFIIQSDDWDNLWRWSLKAKNCGAWWLGELRSEFKIDRLWFLFSSLSGSRRGWINNVWEVSTVAGTRNVIAC